MPDAHARQLLVTLHDVAPVHLERLEKAEEFFREVGLTKVTYLLVPNYHNRGQANENTEFRKWMEGPRSFALRWFLHGYYHQEIEGERIHPLRHPKDWLLRRVLCKSEGEFLSLSDADLAERLNRAQRVFADCLGFAPEGFVAPAWLFRKNLPAELARRGFVVTEDHTRIYDLKASQSRISPVITWAVSDAWMKYASLLSAPLMAGAGSSFSQLRMALHPHDFDHPQVVAQIKRLLKGLLRRRRAVFYDEIPPR